MSAFEILCVTMHQRDFSKIEEMNIHSDVLFANQSDRTELTQMRFECHRARMITTDTRGVGKNRNLALTYAEGDICLFADDDVVYQDDMEQRILAEFEAYPDADIIVFHLKSTDKTRVPGGYKRTRKVRFWERMPWGCVRIAFRRNAIQKANLWFNTLFGGGCIFPSGEDSLWLHEARKRGLTFYVSDQTIGTINYDTSTWFTGFDESFYYGKGAYHQAVHPRMFWFWQFYVLYRFRGKGDMNNREKLAWIRHGREGYLKMTGFADYMVMLKNEVKL